MKKFLLALIMGTFFLPSFSQTEKDIFSGDMLLDVAYLASDNLQGRYPGTPGDKKAAEYIVKRMKDAGLMLLFDHGFQHFPVTTSIEVSTGNALSFNQKKYKLDEDFLPLSFSKNTMLESELVFCGYGFDLKNDSLEWNDYAGINVKGKWVMVLMGDPEPDEMFSAFVSQSSNRAKAVTAVDHGAAGLIIVAGPGYNKNDKLSPLHFDQSVTGSSIPVINITRKVADEWLISSNTNIGALEQKANESMQAHSFGTKEKIKASVAIRKNKTTTYNLVGMIGDDKSKDYIVIGAHYDHLGLGGPTTGSRMRDTIAVHNGADDNASGVSGVLEIAEKLASFKGNLNYNYVFVAFGAEEMGLLGSRYFVQHMPQLTGKPIAMINMDMIGRMDPETKKLSVSGTGTFAEADSLLKHFSKRRTFNISQNPDGYGPSDHSSFYSEKIPVLFFSTGAHTDYHTPFDDVELLDFAAMESVVKYIADVTLGIDAMGKAPTYKASNAPISSRHGRRLKVKLGIVPDIAADLDGLRVDGVRENGPAGKGGIKKGDVIRAINGLAIHNVYDYMARLSKLKVGQTAIIEVLREGKKEVLLIQL